VQRQCLLLDVPRSTYYYQQRPESAENLRLLRRLDVLYLDRPFFGSRRMAVTLGVGRTRIRRLMRILGIEAHYPKCNLSRTGSGSRDLPVLAARRLHRTAQPGLEHRYYVPSDAWRHPLPGGRNGLVQPLRDQLGTLQHHGDRLLSDGVEAAFRFGQPEIWNSDQGSQFTAAEFLMPLKDRGIRISMDGRGRALDNVFIERLWRSLKYELIYPGDFVNGADLFQALDRYFHFYNHQRPHQALGYRTPADLFPRRPIRKRSSP